MAQFPFIGPSYMSRSANVDAEKCINLYPEMNGPNAKSVASLIGTPGLALWAALAGSGVRGLLRFNASIAVAVAGPNVYVVDPLGSSTLVGNIVAGTEPISMSSNGIVVSIVAGTQWYSLDPATNVFKTLIASGFTGADTIDFLDGYFVFNKSGTGQFQITGLYTTDTDPLDFATAEGSPDLIVTLIVDHRELWLLNEKTVEVYFNTPDGDFPFQRIQGAFIEQGCAAKRSVAKMDNSIFWLTSDDRGQGMVVRAQGYQPQRISNHALEFAISQYSDISDAVAFTYQEEGHSFYMLSFPTGNATWVYDASTDMWHQRAYRNPADNSLNRHRAQCHMYFAGKHIVGDWENGNLYVMDLDTYTDNGALIRRVRSTPHAAAPDYSYLRFASLQIDMQTGVGLNGLPGTPGVDPKAMLRWSDDGGYTWPNTEWADIGKIGERTSRVLWRRLGKSRDRVFEVTITEPVKVVLIGAAVKMWGQR